MKELPSASIRSAPLASLMNTGVAPGMDLKERTGEETPPGMSLTASAKSFSDFAYRSLGLISLAMGDKHKRYGEWGKIGSIRSIGEFFGIRGPGFEVWNALVPQNRTRN